MTLNELYRRMNRFLGSRLGSLNAENSHVLGKKYFGRQKYVPWLVQAKICNFRRFYTPISLKFSLEVIYAAIELPFCINTLQ